MLLAPSADRTEAAQAAVRELSKHVDSIDARNLDPEGSLAAAISKLSLFSTKSSVDTFVVDLAKVENWADWLNSKSKNFRQTLGGQRLNISKLGELELEEDNFDIIAWIFNEKRAWLLRFNKESEWIENSEMGEGFFSKLHRQPGNPLKLFALRLDGIYIAAALCLVSHKSLEYFVTTYSMAGTWDRFSPGMLVSEDCGRWACENGLDLDFRALDVPYKHRWASSTKSRVTISAAFSPMGVLRLWIQTLKVNVRRRLESIKRE